jgi:predicted CXXCH cytochrome family protein
MGKPGKGVARTVGVMVAALLAAHGAFAARPNSDCLECHGTSSIIGHGSMGLYVDPGRFNASSHKTVGCVSCHASVSDAHPDDGSKPSRVSCVACHEEIASEYGKSPHAKNAQCVDCHNPHQSRKLSYVSGEDVNATCANCHGMPASVLKHGKWLPQAALHLRALPCITCHTGSQSCFINLFIEKEEQKGDFRLASYQELGAMTPDRGVPSLIDNNGDRYISQLELRAFNSRVRRDGMRLRGVMMPEVMSHRFEILQNRRDCTFCHVSRSKTVQSSFVSFPTASGGYRRVPVENGAVLDILRGTPDFYMTGATRSKALSVIGGLLILCGLVMPVGHGLMRFWTRANRSPEIIDPADAVEVYLQPTPIRIWHWINAFSIVTLCLTGAQIRFPDLITIFGRYQGVVYLHNLAGLMMSAFMGFWIIYYFLISRSIGRVYFLTGEDLKHGMLRQAVFYFFNYFRGRENPFHPTPAYKFNALQKMAYLVIMFVFMPLVMVTGFLLLDIEPVRTLMFRLGGIKLIDGIHFLSACTLCAFVFTHFYLTTLGPTFFSEIRTMWTGWEKEAKTKGEGAEKP